MTDLTDLDSTVQIFQIPAIVTSNDLKPLASNIDETIAKRLVSLLPISLSSGNNKAEYKVTDGNVTYRVTLVNLTENRFLFLFKEKNPQKTLANLSKTKLNDYLAIIDEYAWETDKHLYFSFLSEKTKEILGFNPKEIAGVSIKDIIPHTDWLNLFESIKQHILRKETFFNIVHRATRKDGEQIWLNTTGIPLYNEEDEFKGIRGVSQDITHKKNALESLELSQKNYKLLFDQTPSGVFTYDKNLILQNCNEAFSRILEVPKDVLLNLDIKTLKDKRIIPTIRQGLKSEKSIYEGEYHTTNSGITIYISMTCVPLVDNNTVIGGIGLVKDITKAHTIEKKLKRQLKFEALALEISNLFINLSVKDTHPTIDVALEKIGSFLKLKSTRLYLLGEKGRVFYAPNYWTSNKSNLLKPYQVFDIRQYTSLINELKSNQFVIEKTFYALLNTPTKTGSHRSMFFPLLAENSLLGFWELTFKSTDDIFDKDDSEIIILKQLAHTFSSVIARNKKIEQLELKEKRFESLVLNLSDMITVLNKDGRILYNTTSFYKTTGYGKSVIGKNIGHLIHPNDLKYVLGTFFQIRKTSRSEVSIELRLKKSDGSYGFFESFISNLIHIPSINGIVINSREITDRKKYERALYENQTFISAVSKAVPGYIVVYDTETQKIIYKNRNHFIVDKLFEQTNSPKSIESNRLDGKKNDLNEFKETITSGIAVKNKNFQFRILESTGNYSWYSCSVNPFSMNVEETNKQVLVLINNITEQRQSEIIQEVLFKIAETARTVITTDELYKLLFMQLNRLVPLENYFLALSYDNGQTIEFPYQYSINSTNFRKRLKGGALTDYVIKSGNPLIADYDTLLNYQENGDFVVNGKLPVSVIAAPLKIKGNSMGAIVIYSYNHMVTYTKKHLNTLSFICNEIAVSLERKKFADSLQEERVIANSIINNLPGIYFLADKNGKLLRWNKNLEELISHSAGFLKSFSIFDVLEESSDLDLKSKVFSVFDNQHIELETKITFSNNKSIPILLTCLKVIIKGEAYISGIGIDITEKTKAALQIQQSLNEKQILLSEVHHRVKNNLAIVTGLLNLQQHSQLDGETRNALKDSETRIRSMAIIHEKLYQSEIFSSIEVTGYLYDLAGYIERVFETNCDISVEINCNSIYLPLGQAIPFGLIVNELFTNCYKHAFKGRQKGKITVHLTLNKGKQLCLKFSDNGVGFDNTSKDFETSLGFKLINGLTLQLSGKSTFIINNGTHFELKFIIDEKNTHS